MATRKGPKRKSPAEKPARRSKVEIEKVKAEAEAALAWAKEEEKARLKAEAALAEAQEALAEARAKVDEERLTPARTEGAKPGTERALEAAKGTIEREAADLKAPPTPDEEEGEQRVSFVVRLTVDERGQPRRTEVEHVQSGKKERHPTLDVRRLATFMEEMSVRPPVFLERTATPLPAQVIGEAPLSVLLRPARGLTVSDLRVSHKETPHVSALTLNPDEAFVVQVRFRLQGAEARSLTAQGSSFDMRVYAREVTSGRSTLLITHSDNLNENVLEYTPQTLASGLPPGLYSLLAVICIQAPTSKMVGHHDGPIVQVARVQPYISPARAPQESAAL